MEAKKKIRGVSKAWLCFFVVALIFSIVELNGLDHVEPGDEYTYIYMGKLVSEGKMPYRDFFLAHPPVQVLLFGAIYSIFGFKLVLFKLVPFVSILVAAFFIFKLMKEKFGNAEAVMSVILFLFSYGIMLEATYALGMNLATMFAVAGFYFLIARKKYFISGLLFGFAGITGLYSLIPTGVILVFLLIKNRKSFIWFFCGFCAVFVTVNTIFALIAPDFITQVYKYHLMKPKVEGNTLAVFFSVLQKNALLFLAAILVLFSKRKKALQLACVISIVYMIFLLCLNRIFNFYFVLLFALLSIIGSCCLVEFFRQLKLGNNMKKIIFVLFAISVIATTVSTSMHLNSFDFADFQAGDALFGFIERNSEEGEAIFGDNLIAPMAALYTERKLAFDMADTNDMRFTSGVSSINEAISRLKDEKVRLIIIRPLYGIGTISSFGSYLTNECKLVFAVKDEYWADFLVFDCMPKQAALSK